MSALKLDVRRAGVREDAHAMPPSVLWGDPGAVCDGATVWPRTRSLAIGIDAWKVAGHVSVDKPAEGAP
ncbi:MAG: hypothetical protein K2Y02_04920 [Burkholderiaceae bacterium]|nr:hypothetical protein [Burkholderiaceae bacterium]